MFEFETSPMLFGHLDLGLSRGGGCSELWGLYVVGFVFHFVCFGFGVSVWAAEAAGKSSEEVGVTPATGRKNTELGSLHPGVTEVECCPISCGTFFGQPGLSEKDCQNSCFLRGRFRLFRLRRWKPRIWPFQTVEFIGL